MVMELETNYTEILRQAVAEINAAKVQVAKQINTTAIAVYWNLGKLLSEQKIEKGYGAGVVNRLSVDLKSEFPDMGLSPRNLWNMKRFFERYNTADAKLQRCVAVLPWRHNMLLLEKLTDDEQAMYYAQKSIEYGWTKDILLNYIKADSYHNEKHLPKSHNFGVTLPEDLAEQANEILKSSYNLGFLGVTKPIKERELEKRLVEKVKQFVLELGRGFSFIGNQYRLEFNQKEYFVDMLFFHRDLKALVAIELKVGEFKPEYVGKMNFYLTLLDKLEKKQGENPSIGIILCADKNHLEVEIALQDMHKPIGVAEYKLLLPTEALETMLLNELNKENE